MVFIFLLVVIIIILILVILYVRGNISGSTLIIIILIIIILLIVIPSLLGFAVLASLKEVCMNASCNIIKLPVTIKNIGQYDAKNTLYSINMNER